MSITPEQIETMADRLTKTSRGIGRIPSALDAAKMLRAIAAQQRKNDPIGCIHPDTLAAMQTNSRMERAALRRWTEVTKLDGYVPLYTYPQQCNTEEVTDEWQKDVVRRALQFAAGIIELYDDATIDDDHMIASGDCADILNAIADHPEIALTTQRMHADLSAVTSQHNVITDDLVRKAWLAFDG